MKYLKTTLVLFIATFVFALVNVEARVVHIAGITIPVFKGTYMSSQQNKSVDNLQYIKKISCIDNLSGDGRAIDARAHGMLAGMTDSPWVEAKPNQKVSFGANSKTIGIWKLYLQSRKSLPTTATFSGEWTIDS